MLEANPANGQQLDGGYLNSVVRHGHSVRKVYLGTQAAARRLREYRALTRLAGRLSVPGVLPGGDDHTLVFEFVDGVNGQRLIRDGHPGLVLRLCGAMLRKLQAFDVSSMQGMLPGSGEVITHGDFGPQNVLIHPGPQEISAVIDWEFCRLGDPIEDLAWAEWIIRRHHTDTIEFLPELFAGYGREPAWAERKQSMLKSLRRMRSFAIDNGGNRDIALWDKRIAETSAWVQPPLLVERKRAEHDQQRHTPADRLPGLAEPFRRRHHRSDHCLEVVQA